MAKSIPILTDKQLELFWNKIDIRGDDECWPWTGAKMWKGYGVVALDRSVYRACRVMLALHGHRNDSLMCCHSCNNRGCVNPKHLRLGTAKENHMDRLAAGNPTNRGKHYRQSPRLSEADVCRVRALYGNVSNVQIAKLFGVSASTIGNIGRGKPGNI
jgi:hypothetical protein